MGLRPARERRRFGYRAKRLRDECLNEHLFKSYDHARKIITESRIDYNNQRPHSAHDGLTPKAVARRSASDRLPNPDQLRRSPATIGTAEAL